MVRANLRAMRHALLYGLLLVTGACTSVEPAVFPAPVRDGTGVFLVHGDSRDGLPLEPGAGASPQERAALMARMVAESPDFVIHAGDIARVGGMESQWLTFDADYAPLRDAGIALVPVLGNHEYLGSNEDGLDSYFARFPHLLGRKWYDLRYRDLLLLVLDSNVGELAEYERAAQDRWLGETLDAAEADGSVGRVLVFTHHPALSNRSTTGSGPEPWVRETVLAAARDHGKVRAIFSGHVHTYERFVVGHVQCVVTGGGGSPLHALAGKETLAVDAYEGARRYHFVRIEVGEGVRATVEMLGEDGSWSTVDAFDL